LSSFIYLLLPTTYSLALSHYPGTRFAASLYSPDGTGIEVFYLKSKSLRDDATLEQGIIHEVYRLEPGPIVFPNE